MLADPPAEAHPDKQVGVDQPNQVVGPPGAEDLPAPGAVAHEGDLGEHHRQVGGGEELPSGVSEEQQGGPSGGEQGPLTATLARYHPRRRSSRPARLICLESWVYSMLPGKHEPGLGSSRPHLGSPQVLLDAAQLGLALGLCP
jgi:hypothetical protein